MTYIALRADHAHLRKVRKRLRRKGNVAYVPALVTKRIIPKGLKTRRKRHVIPLMSYILVKVPEAPSVWNLWLHDVLATKDVRGYVKIDEGPALIPNSNIEHLKAEVARLCSEVAQARHKARLRSGGKATIKTGSLAGKIGTVEWIKGKRVGLEAKLFGSTRVIEVAKENLEAA